MPARDFYSRLALGERMGDARVSRVARMGMDTKIYKTMTAHEGTLLKMDTIHHDGRYWLVPDWLIAPDGMTMKPRIAIDITAISHGEVGGAMGDFVIHHSLPPGALDGKITGPMANLVEILDQPEIWFTNPDKLN